ncbi:hypothetical protein VZT92_005983 [Zoarces viviparus]|uniref:Spt4/RpoE2 zinc finger domain-containing protein n=1 Tax=Zoarces viviparus TaxID=48416 RepID=A0AAW1FPS4_ZOAVI
MDPSAGSTRPSQSTKHECFVRELDITALETVPKDLRHLRACLLCSLVKTIDQFEYDGCDNCESYLQMKGNREMVYECTSSSFDGVVSMMRTAE